MGKILINKEIKYTNEEINGIKATYPLGTRLKVLSIDDPYISLPVGTLGEVVLVDDKGRIYISLSNKRIVTLDYSKDKVIKV